MANNERVVSISTAAIFKVIAVVIILGFLWAVRDVLAIVFTALIMAALMTPFSTWARKFKIPPSLSVLLFYIVFIGGFILAFALMLPQLIEQGARLGVVITKSWKAVSGGVVVIRDLSAQYGLTSNLEAGITALQDYFGSVASGLFTTVTGILGGFATFVLVLVIAYYMVVEEQEAAQWFKNIIPEEYQAFTAGMLTRVQEKFGRWFAGQLLLSIIVGTLYYIGLRLLGVEGALVIAVFGGFAEIIPYLGPILSGAFAFVVALSQSPAVALLVIVLFVVVQQLENHVLVPKIMQKAVGLNPVISIVALLVGAKLFGIVGAILSIPVATALSVAVMEFYRFQRKGT